MKQAMGFLHLGLLLAKRITVLNIFLLTLVLILVWLNLSTDKSAETCNPKTYNPMVAIQQRQRRVEKICRVLKKPDCSMILTEGRFIVSDKHKVIYCDVPKVASTSWKFILGKMEGLNKRTVTGAKWRILESENQTVKTVHPHFQSFKYLNSYSLKDAHHRLTFYKKFMIVRHPFERLISAFRDKFQDTFPDRYYETFIGTDIIKHYRTNATQEELRRGAGVTFKEFIKWLGNNKRPAPPKDDYLINIHWENYQKICSPCCIHYDFIGKYESIAEDSNFILENILPHSLRSKLKFPVTHANVVKTKDIISHYFGKISHADMAKLYALYAIDFDMFGYSLGEIV